MLFFQVFIYQVLSDSLLASQVPRWEELLQAAQCLSPENWSPGLNANSQFKITRTGLEVREIKLIIHQTKRRTGRVNLSKHCRPPSERTCPPFNGEVRAQLDWVIICVSTMAGGLGSSGVQGHFSEAVCLAGRFTALVSEREEG
jgi:hypothetical protein